MSASATEAKSVKRRLYGACGPILLTSLNTIVAGCDRRLRKESWQWCEQ